MVIFFVFLSTEKEWKTNIIKELFMVQLNPIYLIPDKLHLVHIYIYIFMFLHKTVIFNPVITCTLYFIYLNIVSCTLIYLEPLFKIKLRFAYEKSFKE